MNTRNFEAFECRAKLSGGPQAAGSWYLRNVPQSAVRGLLSTRTFQDPTRLGRRRASVFLSLLAAFVSALWEADWPHKSPTPRAEHCAGASPAPAPRSRYKPHL